MRLTGHHRDGGRRGARPLPSGSTRRAAGHPDWQPGRQTLERWVRHGTEYTPEYILPVAFVPLRGEFGWKKEGWGSIF
jgi:hypothetical protein